MGDVSEILSKPSAIKKNVILCDTLSEIDVVANAPLSEIDVVKCPERRKPPGECYIRGDVIED